MAGNLRSIRKRIGSVKNTRQITRAMKMVSGAKLRRAEERIRAFRPYAQGVEAAVRSLVVRSEGRLRHPLLESGVAGAPPLYVLVTSDRGLSGAFNANVFKKLGYWAEDEGLRLADFSYYTIGRRGRDFARRNNLSVLGSAVQLSEPPAAQTVGDIASTLIDAFVQGAAGKVVFVYNRYVNALTQTATFQQLLPLELPATAGNLAVPHLTEPDPQTLLDTLMPRLVEARVEAALRESQAGEHGARMTAMDSATRNAGDMINSLTLSYNRARQAAITSELLDIINGKNSIE